MKIELKIRAQPKQRPRKGRHGMYSPKSAYDRALPKLLKGIESYPATYYKIDITYYFKRPNSHLGTGKNSGKIKDSAPKMMGFNFDLDNLTKGTLDAMVNANILSDDRKVVDIRERKFYANDDSVVIKVMDAEDLGTLD